MMAPKDGYDWYSLWSDLLQGVGAGLLRHDGSPLAQAALMGLEAFDAAQQRRGRWDPRALEDDMGDRGGEDEALPLPDLSAAEIAAFSRLTPAERAAFSQEVAELNNGRRPPQSVNPFEGWALERILPFGRDGSLNLPTVRR